MKTWYEVSGNFTCLGMGVEWAVVLVYATNSLWRQTAREWAATYDSRRCSVTSQRPPSEPPLRSASRAINIQREKKRLCPS